LILGRLVQSQFVPNIFENFTTLVVSQELQVHVILMENGHFVDKLYPFFVKMGKKGQLSQGIIDYPFRQIMG